MNISKNIFVIMVGGVGSRLRPYTYSLPKPLLTANGISPLENSIKNIKKESKSNEIYLVVGYKKDIFKKWVKQKVLVLMIMLRVNVENALDDTLKNTKVVKK